MFVVFIFLDFGYIFIILGDGQLVVFQFIGAMHLSSSTVGEEEKVSTLAMPECILAGFELHHATPAQPPYSIS